ncbi:hypothetical protein [Nakamurella lactea]|uniref:hypothetical protein n=1 Tax=Nakamurella lactea TaxID=459515 RepID=UPI000A01CB15|nr:hypothetical protein [Nakamurella lactea]
MTPTAAAASSGSASTSETGASAPPPAERHGGLQALCFVSSDRPDREHTIHLPAEVANLLVRITLSYRGPCADYGQSAPRGKGTLTAYSQSEHGRPSAIGLVFPDRTLIGLPTDPPSDGQWCFDKNADGTTDPMTECTDGYGSTLQLSEHFKSSVDTQFTYLLINWNPMGHPPMHVYDSPHFDIHFYLNANSERLKIRTGPCGELVNCDDFELGKVLPPAKYNPPKYEFTGAVAPGMGNHLINTDAPEFHGQPFTHSWIQGTWNGKVTFYEPMVTKAWFAGLIDGTRPSRCFPIPPAQAVQAGGWYPTRYCLRHRDNRHEITASLEDFDYRQAA